MQVPDLFPIQLRPSDKYGFADSPYVADRIWRRLREEDEECKGITWYATGIIIHGIDKVVIDVYDMEDSFHGGIGQIVFSTEVNRFTPREEEMIFAIIDHRKLELAELEYNRRKEQARIAAILEVKKEMFGE